MERQGMILAAGYGKRMLPLTLDIPKPMVNINNNSLLEYNLLQFVNAGITRIAINIHYLATKLKDHINDLLIKHDLKQKLDILISHEDTILETGGGIKKVLSFFENRPFFAINSDSLLINQNNIYNQLEESFYSFKASQVLVVIHKDKAIGYKPEKGDFTLIENKLFIYEKNQFSFVGLQIIHPSLISQHTENVFSLYKIFQKLIDMKQLYGIEFQGNWLHIGDIKSLESAKNYFHNLSL